jgi:Putative Flp pilus-assembly TadE/G-like
VWRALADRLIRDNRGAVIVMTAMFLPVALLFSGFVIDVANWYEHKRHLQTQADAAALAGAGSFLACPNNEPILDKTEEYGGATWNPQVGDTQGSVHMEVNSETYYDQPSGLSDPTVVEEPPCEAEMVDVKLTETDLPWWFDATQDIDYINAHARVEFQEVDTLSGVMPFGVPDVKPLSARVFFVDEDTGQTLESQALTRRIYASGIAVWDNLDAPVDVTLPDETKNIGVRVALSGTTSTNCLDPLVECYDLGSDDGILYARAWSPDPASPTAPQARHVGLTSSVQDGCSDPYFTEAPAAGCNVGVVAQLDLGGGLPADYTVTAAVGNRRRSLQYDPTNDVWVSNELIQIDPAAGPVPIALNWRAGRDSGTFGMVQRTFSASARSGPIKQATLWADGASGVSSFEKCSATLTDCTYSLAVQLGIQGSFEDLYQDLQNVTEPVTLRFAGGESGSQNQALDCDPWNEDPAIGGGTRGFVDEIAYGCRPTYAPNTGTACPASPNELWGTSTSEDDQGEPWECVAVETGDRVNQLATGLNLRILGDRNPTECTNPNNWDEVTQAPDPAEADDPRIIHLFLTQFGAFASEGQNTIPVTNFATFYVTGWKGQGGGQSPCENPPAPAQPDDPVSESGTVVGHFMQYRGPLGDNTGTEPCNFDGPTPCVFALTE